MRKLAITIGILSVLVTNSLVFTTSAQAGSWVCTPNYMGGQTCTYRGW